MGRHTCCNKQKVRRGLWSPEEDEKLIRYISNHGLGSWSSVPKLAGLERCGKSCRLRWVNYLRPDLKRGSFSPQEESLIIELHRILGNRWCKIAKHLPGRTDNEVKNFWNSAIKKKLIARAINTFPVPDLYNSSTPPVDGSLLQIHLNENQLAPFQNYLHYSQREVRIGMQSYHNMDRTVPQLDLLSNYRQMLLPLQAKYGSVPYDQLSYSYSSFQGSCSTINAIPEHLGESMCQLIHMGTSSGPLSHTYPSADLMPCNEPIVNPNLM